jgi:transposase-like protein
MTQNLTQKLIADVYRNWRLHSLTKRRHRELFADKQNHINGIENLWNQAKRHLRRFNGVPREHFYLFLKECEWRFNNSDPKSQ